jgi:hypothetical protein
LGTCGWFYSENCDGAVKRRAGTLIENMSESEIFCAVAYKFWRIRRAASISGLAPMNFRVVLLRRSAYRR